MGVPPVTSEPEVFSDMYDIFFILRKRVRLILGMFIVAVALTCLLNFILPRIYEDTIVVSIPVFSQLSYGPRDVSTLTSVISSDEVVTFISYLDKLRTENGQALAKKIGISEPAAANVKKISARSLNDSRVEITIEVTDPALFDGVSAGLMRILNDNSYIKERILLERSALGKLENGLEQADTREMKFKKIVEQKINSDNIKYLGFNPLILEDSIVTLNGQLNKLKNQISLFKGFEKIDEFIQHGPVRPRKTLNIVLAGFFSLCFGALLALILERVERGKAK